VIEPAAWLERDFAFGLPLTLFPGVLERLRGTPARLEDRLAEVGPARLAARAGATWSILEHVGHLVQVEELHVGRLDDFGAGAPRLRAAAHDPGRVPAARFNDRAVRELLAEFREARRRHVRRLEALDAAGIGRTARHPRLERDVNVLDMMVFAAEHDDHHLARITALLAAR
jgi:uncharacterized damage-inducible protein DinB